MFVTEQVNAKKKKPVEKVDSKISTNKVVEEMNMNSSLNSSVQK